MGTNQRLGKSRSGVAARDDAGATRRRILAAAADLFATNGYDQVTMRQIAAKVGRSHTTIYLYFKDKQGLLHALSEGPLIALRGTLESILEDDALAPIARLKAVGRATIRFCLANPNTFNMVLAADAGRVDELHPSTELNVLRNQMFGLLTEALSDCLPSGMSTEDKLMASRIHFFVLRGIVGTYVGSKEPLDSLMTRLEPTFDEAADVVLTGLGQRAAKRAGLRPEQRVASRSRGEEQQP